MKAAVYTQYGPPDVLHIKEVEKPTPGDNDVLIRVHATHISYGELIARRFGHVSPREFNMPSLFWFLARIEFGLRTPKKQILGSEFAGQIEAVGKAVTRFKVGDSIFGYLGANFGANAEYVCMPEGGMLAIKPINMTSEEAATIPYGALTALNLLRKANIQRGQKVLINGASGSIGSAAVQLAKYFGAEVTGVCGTGRMDYVKSLGADHVIDYTREDFTKRGETYDLVFDILGRSSFSRCKRVLTPDGLYLLASFKMKQLLQMLWTSRVGRKKVICALSMEKKDDLLFIKELAEAGTIKTSIDRCYPMENIAEAHRYVETGQHKGPVIVALERGV